MMTSNDHIQTVQDDILTKDTDQGQGVKEEKEKLQNNKAKLIDNDLNNTILKDFDSVDTLGSEPEETTYTEQVGEDNEGDSYNEIAQKNMSCVKSSKRSREDTWKDETFCSKEPLRKKRTNKCGSCEGCLTIDCDKCKACMDKPRNGGKSKIRQRCYSRKCSSM